MTGQVNAQTVFFKSKENFGVCNESFDFKTNTVSFSPKKDSLNTCALWFRFGLTSFRKDTVLTVKSTFDESTYNPYFLVFSYDNKEFFPLKNHYSGKHLSAVLKPERDTVFFATGYPYSYETLKKFLDENTPHKNLVKTENLDTTSSFYIPLLTITSKKDSPKKKLIWIICRQHAFESVANYVMEGMLKYLLSKDCKKKLLKRYVFKIVPMTDVENVAAGLSGRMSKPRDYNRDWDSPIRDRIKMLENQITESAKKYKYFMFFDVHGTFPCGNLGTADFSYFDLKGDKEKSRNLEEYFKRISAARFRPIPDNQQTYGGMTADWWNFLNFKELKFSTTVEIDWIENYETYYKIGEEMIKGIF
ncbi:MAG: hypothetical protein II956_00120 [Bacteroidales bacterium]|nr:hypothetical protein [Bacteroidales bacterium]